jgi:hypothetical protein
LTIKFSYNTDIIPSSYILEFKVSDIYKNFQLTKGIIDTGSACTAIPNKLTDELNLRYVGKVILRGINGISKYKIYYANIQIRKPKLIISK